VNTREPYWSVLVSRTTPNPQPGSDEINRAYEEGWVGNDRLAFIGDTLSQRARKCLNCLLSTCRR
jgi:hypothetical protein